ncbi:MAG: DMT family transporter [Coriobacteriia bacterium]|nr:DMT family transporter [Coriobacteriia bacterium]
MSDGKSNVGAVAVGSAFAVLQAVLYSTMGIFGKVLYATGLGPQEVLVLRYACSTVLLGAFLLIWRKQSLMSRDPVVYVLAALGFLSSATYFLAVERMSAGLTTVVFYTYPAVVAVASIFVFKEQFTLSTFLSLVLAMGGLILVSGVHAGDVVLDALGMAYAVVSCLAFAVYTLLIQKHPRKDGPMTFTFTLSCASLVGSCVLFAPVLPNLVSVTAEQIGLSCALALACTLLPIPLYLEAVKRIGGTRASLLGITETPSSLLLAFLVLGEVLTFDQALGSALIVLSIAVITVAPLVGKRMESLPGQTKSD